MSNHTISTFTSTVIPYALPAHYVYLGPVSDVKNDLDSIPEFNYSPEHITTDKPTHGLYGILEVLPGKMVIVIAAIGSEYSYPDQLPFDTVKNDSLPVLTLSIDKPAEWQQDFGWSYISMDSVVDVMHVICKMCGIGSYSLETPREVMWGYVSKSGNIVTDHTLVSCTDVGEPLGCEIPFYLAYVVRGELIAGSNGKFTFYIRYGDGPFINIGNYIFNYRTEYKLEPSTTTQSDMLMTYFPGVHEGISQHREEILKHIQDKESKKS